MSKIPQPPSSSVPLPPKSGAPPIPPIIGGKNIPPPPISGPTKALPSV